MARLFLAIWLPDDVTEHLMSLPRKDQRGVRFIRPENWHITLRFLGEANPDKVIDELAGIDLQPAIARLGPAVDVLDERSLIVPVHGVDATAVAVHEATSAVGNAPRQRFNGHLTIARVKSQVPMPLALGTLTSAQFDVAEIALVLSRLHPEGARYQTLETWPVGTTPSGF